MRIPYKHIAAAFAINIPKVGDRNSYAFYIWQKTVHDMVDVLASANPKFDRRRFLTAAGVLSEQEK